VEASGSQSTANSGTCWQAMGQGCVWRSGPAPVLEFKVGAAVAFHGREGWWGGGLRLTQRSAQLQRYVRTDNRTGLCGW
jgi:hypothetical protein